MQAQGSALRSFHYPDPQPALTLTLPADPPVRMGLLGPFTDVDAFIQALLGGVVPRHPRFLTDPLVVPIELQPDSPHDPVGVPRADIHVSHRWLREERLRDRLLNWFLSRQYDLIGRADPALAEFVRLEMMASVAGSRARDGAPFAEVHQALRRGPYARQPASLRAFRPLHIPLGEQRLWRRAVVVYQHPMPRAALAARIRSVHRTFIAPWSRSPYAGLRLQRLLVYIARAGQPRVPVANVAAELLRLGHADVDEERLLHRLEKWSSEAADWIARPIPNG